MKVGTDEWLEEEFELLRKYNSFYVQVLQHCFEFGGGKFYLCEIPLYDEFKGNLDRFTKPSYKDSTYLNKSGEEVLFEQDLESKYLWCKHSDVWSFFESKFGYEYLQIQELISDILKEHLRQGVLVPSPSIKFLLESDKLKEDFKEINA